MLDAYSILILFSSLWTFLGIIFLYIYIKKDKRSYFLVSSVFCFLGPVLTITGILLNAENLAASSMLLPFGLLIISTCVDIFVRYIKCSVPVPATCVSFEDIKRRITPQFLFNYNGEKILAYSFVSYPNRIIKKNFEIDGIYDIFINPQNPRDCVDKRRFPFQLIPLLIFGIYCSVVGLLFAASGIFLRFFFAY